MLCLSFLWAKELVQKETSNKEKYYKWTTPCTAIILYTGGWATWDCITAATWWIILDNISKISTRTHTSHLNLLLDLSHLLFFHF